MSPRLVPDMILARADAAPAEVAITCAGEALTYRELAQLSEQIACRLLAAGAGPGDRVAVALPPSPTVVAVMLASWRIGAAYVTVDPRYPAERRSLMLADCAAAVLVAEDERDDLTGYDRPQLRVAELLAPRPGARALPAGAGAAPDSIAYVIYTSGSTGRPKGVMVDHQNLASFVTADERLDIRPGEVVAAAAPISFDASVFEIWMTLARGARVSMFPAQQVSVDTLGAFLREAEPDWLFLTSGMFHLLADQDLSALGHVGTLITGGDVLSPGQISAAARTVRRRVMAAYGPTETTVFASLHPLAAAVTSTRVPIGSPLAGTVFRILDDRLAPVAPGEIGTLFISGPGVSRGYLGQPERTAECFVDDPFAAGPAARMYNTGDLAREVASGVYEFRGRTDRQVKIRGFRVELGEIEAVASSHPAAAAAAASVFGEGPALKRVVLFAKAVAGAPLLPSELRLWLAERLPAYMLPSAVIMLDEAPLDPNGKLDRAALPYPWQRRDELGLPEPYDEPRTPVEQAIAKAWADTLELDRVGRNDNFFEIGGDSLRSVELVARLAEDGISIRGEVLLDYQTIAELAMTAVIQGDVETNAG